MKAVRTGFNQTSMKTGSSSLSWQLGRGSAEGTEGRGKRTHTFAQIHSWKSGIHGVLPLMRKQSECLSA